MPIHKIQVTYNQAFPKTNILNYSKTVSPYSAVNSFCELLLDKYKGKLKIKPVQSIPQL